MRLESNEATTKKEISLTDLSAGTAFRFLDASNLTVRMKTDISPESYVFITGNCCGECHEYHGNVGVVIIPDGKIKVAINV